jgi:serralysin
LIGTIPLPPSLIALLLGGLAALAGGLSSGRSSRDDDDDGDGPAGGDDPESGDAPPAPGSPGAIAPGPSPDSFPDLPDTAYGLDWAGLTPEEQLIVELVNRARMDPAAEVARLDEPLASGIPGTPAQPLAVTRSLSLAAREHSEDMDNRDFFSHTNPDGQSPGARAIEEGHGSGFVGENIGWIGSTSTSFDGQTRAEAHHHNLWDSDGHQRNLMDARWSEIGVGYDRGSYQGYNGSTFVTEMFGDRGHSYLTGVVIEDGDGDDFYDIGEGLGGVRITAWDGTNTFGTETWAAGGYSLRLAAGTYDVLFEGGGLDRAVTRTVTIGGDNVKLDVVEDNGTVTFASRLPEPAPQAGAVLAGLPVIPMEDQPLPVEEEEAELLWA